VIRRDVIAVAAGLIGVPGASQAQTKPSSNKIGYIHPRTISPDHPTLKILRAAWQRLGYVEGENVLLRSAGGELARIPTLVSELASLGAGVLIVVGAAAIRSATQATRTTAIVGIDLETDPVRAGYAASFARPGGNVTGLFLDQPSIAGKWIDLLRDAVPDIQRLVILWDASTGVDQLNIARSVAARDSIRWYSKSATSRTSTARCAPSVQSRRPASSN
jgi:putative ABC transport system substrate-binding protein